MNCVDRPRTSADERMLSGRRAVVIVCHQQTGFLAHRVLAPVRGFQFGGALTSSLSQFGGALTEPQSEETVAIQQHSQATDSENFNILVEEYII